MIGPNDLLVFWKEEVDKTYLEIELDAEFDRELLQ